MIVGIMECLNWRVIRVGPNKTKLIKSYRMRNYKLFSKRKHHRERRLCMGRLSDLPKRRHYLELIQSNKNQRRHKIQKSFSNQAKSKKY